MLKFISFHFTGLLALCLVHEERQCDLELVSDKLMTSFNTVVR